MRKKLSVVLMMSMLAASLTACGNQSGEKGQAQATQEVLKEVNAEITASSNSSSKQKKPKYVFLFIGDGMSYPQFQSASDYLGAMQDEDYMQAEPSLEDNQGAKLDGPEKLNFMNFEAAGSAITYDSNSFAPDSASTATSISTGHKTYSGTINMDESGTLPYGTITEKVHSQLGMKVGIISTVNLNHATPAAFYAHQPSRNNYYEIGEELVKSNFEYFAGGGLKDVTGEKEDQENLYNLATEAGYSVLDTAAEAKEAGADDDKVMIIDENLADGDAMKYDLDREDSMMGLSDYVQKGIEVLDNESGFFMMVEGGKIDWACHANDAASSIHDTLALADAVQVAIDFAQKHADETLILVTGDHETGGLTIGYAGTNYDTYLSLLNNQTISFAKFDSDYIEKYKEKNTSFKAVLKDVETLFGLKASGKKDDKMVLTKYEKSLLKTAYEKSIHDKATGMDEQKEYVMYGTYNPLSVTITHILNNKSGVSFTSYSHTGLPVAVFADGVNAEQFNGYYDNTDIYNKVSAMLGVK